MPTKPYLFDIRGSFDIDDQLIPKFSVDGTVMGFKLPNGKVAELIVALVVEDAEGNEEYVTSDQQMRDMGFDNLDYSWADFIEVS